MKPNPFASLLHSRKFWLMILDLVISLITYFGGRYLAPAASTDLIYLIGLLQPVIVALICGIAYEDGAAKAGGVIVERRDSAATVDDVR